MRPGLACTLLLLRARAGLLPLAWKGSVSPISGSEATFYSASWLIMRLALMQAVHPAAVQLMKLSPCLYHQSFSKHCSQKLGASGGIAGHLCSV